MKKEYIKPSVIVHPLAIHHPVMGASKDKVVLEPEDDDDLELD